VSSGARKQEQDWDPEENGGYAVHDTEGKAPITDPLAALEKTTSAQTQLTQVAMPRIESLQEVSEQTNADPYTLSLKLRKRFREEKKIDAEKTKADDKFKTQYGLPAEMKLLAADDEGIKEEAKRDWEKGRRDWEVLENGKRRKMAAEIIEIPPPRAAKLTTKISSLNPSARSTRMTSIPSSSSRKSPSLNNPVASLRARILENTARQSNPFGASSSRSTIGEGIFKQ